MRNTFIILVAGVVFLSCGQAKKEKFQDDIKTSKTSEHQNIPGTKVYLIPPAGFTASKKLPAFEKDNSMIQAMDLEGGNYYTNAKNFTRENFEQKGANVIEYREFSINDWPARMILLQADPSVNMYQLVFGDSTFSTMIMAGYPASDEKAGEAIRQSILTVFYDKETKIDPFARAPFSLDDSQSLFKFAKFAVNIYLYSINGIKKDSYENEPFFMVMPLPTEDTLLKNTANQFLNSFVASKNPFRVTAIKNESSAPVNGFLAYRREVYGNFNGKASVLFQEVVQTGSQMILLQGIGDNEDGKNLQEFKKLASTLHVK